MLTFLAFSCLTCHLGGTAIGCNVLLDSKKTVNSNQDASSSAGKNNKVVLELWCTRKYITMPISRGVDIAEVL